MFPNNSFVNKTLGAISHTESWLAPGARALWEAPQFSLPLFLDLVQRVQHRFTGNADQPAKGLIQLEDQENSAGDGKRRDRQSEEGSGIGRREHAEAKENDDEP